MWGGGYGGIAHKWAAQNKLSGKHGNIFFEGATIYSYGHHFPMARFLDPKTVLVTTRTYSPSTSSHQGAVLDALRGLDVEVFEADRINPHEIDHNVDFMRNAYDEQLGKAARARRYAMYHITDARKIAERFAKYTARFAPNALPLKPIDPAFVAACEERAAKGEAANEAMWAKRREKSRIEREEYESNAKLKVEEFHAKYPGIVEAWNSGEMWRRGEKLPALPYDIQSKLGIITPQETMLRLIDNGRTIETSRSARVPVDVAPMLWRAVSIAHNRRLAQDYSNQAIRIGDFELRRITNEGDVVIGCHTICYAELERMARTLGLKPELSDDEKAVMKHTGMLLDGAEDEAEALDIIQRASK